MPLVAKNTFDLAHRRQKSRKPKEPNREEAGEAEVEIEEQTEAATETREEVESD